MVDTPEESLPQDRDLITDSDALVELMMMDSDEEMEDDVTNVANFNATRLANRKYKNKDRPNYFLCFKVFLLSLIIYSTSTLRLLGRFTTCLVSCANNNRFAVVVCFKRHFVPQE